MLQGSDPFDEFRMKKEISRLEKDFRHSAERKRKRLKELLEEDDGGNPDSIERRVQEEMESFFRESASAAESVFSEVGPEGEVGRQEILDRLEEVLRPVDSGTVPGRSSTVAPSAADGEGGIEEALARIRRHSGGREEGRAPAAPEWLDVTEETIEDGGPTPDGEDPDERRRRILGAFDESAVRFRDMIREGLGDSVALSVETEEHDAPEPPLARRSEPGGYLAPARAPAVAETADRSATATATAEPVPLSLQARLEVLEEEVARLRRVLERKGLLGGETA